MKLNQTINQRVRSGTVILYDYFFFLVFNFYLRFERNWFRGFLFFFHFQLKTKQNKKRSEETKRSFFVFVYFFCSSLYQRTKKGNEKRKTKWSTCFFLFFFLFICFSFFFWVVASSHVGSPVHATRVAPIQKKRRRNKKKLGKTR